jgi:hypothetical protein
MAKELKPQGIDMSAQSASPQTTRQGAQLTREIQARIGHQLRAIYDDVVRQGVPERFAELVRRLDEPDHQTAPSSVQGAAKQEGSN